MRSGIQSKHPRPWKNRLNPRSQILKDGLPETTEPTLQSLRLRTQRFFDQEGRRPRALVGALQRQEGTYPSEQLGSLLAEMGFDVDLQPLLKPADHLAAMALDNDVHAVVILGVGSVAEPLLRDLMQALASGGGEDILLALDHLAFTIASGRTGPIRWRGCRAPAWFRPHAYWTLLNIYGKRPPPRSRLCAGAAS